MQQLDLVIHNPTGLHARPARVLVDIAKKYQSTIRIRYGSKQANAKSLVSLLTLGVTGGQFIQFDINGEDEEIAATALAEAVRDGLGEGPNPNSNGHSNEGSNAHAGEAAMVKVATAPVGHQDQAEIPKVTTPATESQVTTGTGQIIRGVAGAPGIAVGPTFRLQRTEVRLSEVSRGAEQEQNSLEVALETARQQIAVMARQVAERGAKAEMAIFEVHRDILADPALLEPVAESIKDGQSAALAWQTVTRQQATIMASLPDPLLAERSADILDVGDRVLRLLTGLGNPTNAQPDHPVIIVAADLTPSETVALDPQKVLGFCTAQGGPQAHTAILARAIGLPAIVNAGPSILDLADGTPIILDGSTGELQINPNETALTAAHTKRQAQLDHKAAALETAHDAAITRDGHRVEVVANIGSVADARQAAESGAEGVGLLRTEFLFLNRPEAPGEEEQYQIYQAVALALKGQPVIVRTLDIGGDKPIPYLNLPAEDNPFLGTRGIRLCLEHPDLFKEQLRAILRASTAGKLRIMFPMIADSVELKAAKALVEETRASLNPPPPPVEVGIMIEVPSAALLADTLASDVDFFSIGTNDLTQYTLAMDRTHPGLATRADGLHPAVLRLIGQTVEAAHAAGKWVGICGELGADPVAVPILLGLGVDELSVSSPAIPSIKAQIRTLTLTECQKMAQRALKCATAEQVRSGDFS